MVIRKPAPFDASPASFTLHFLFTTMWSIPSLRLLLLLAVTCQSIAISNADGVESACGLGAQPISVFNTAKTFCATGPLCSGVESSSGRCPDPQDGLPFGAYCGRVQTGAFGCIPLALPPAEVRDASQKTESDAMPDCSILPGQVPVAVVNVGNLCAPEPICNGTVLGNCPTTLTDLSARYRCEAVSISDGASTFQCVV